MKKIILLTIAIVTFSFANAQETRFGVKAGLNIAKFSGGSDNTVIPGFHVGGLAEIKIMERLSVQPELLFSTQGAHYAFLGGSSDFKLNYINVPVLAKFYVTEGFTVEAGPQIGFLVSAKDEGNDVKGDFKSVDLGFNFGAGYDFTKKFSVNLRYTLGLSDIRDSEGSNYSPFDGVKNSVFALSLAYKF